MFILFPKRLQDLPRSGPNTSSPQIDTVVIVSEEIVSGVEVRGLDFGGGGCVLNRFPVPATWEDGAADTRAFESSAWSCQLFRLRNFRGVGEEDGRWGRGKPLNITVALLPWPPSPIGWKSSISHSRWKRNWREGVGSVYSGFDPMMY